MMRKIRGPVIVAMTAVLAVALAAWSHEAHRRREISENVGNAGATLGAEDSRAVAAESMPQLVTRPSGLLLAATDTHGLSETGNEESEIKRTAGVIERLGRLHPAVVHFPIALLTMAFLAELLALGRAEGVCASAAVFMVNAAAVTSLPVALLGVAYSFGQIYSASDEANHFEWHRTIGILTTCLALTLPFLRARTGRLVDRVIYMVLLGLTAALVLATGYLGGALTLGTDHFSILWR